MLSRRSTRIKVMQLLFSLSRDKELTHEIALDRYWESIHNSYELYLFNIFVIIQVAKEALTDGIKRKSKHLPTDFDKNFIAKLFLNPLIQDLVKNKILQVKFDDLNFKSKANLDYFKKIYAEFSKMEEYSSYVNGESTNEAHLAALLELYRFCRKDEFFNEMLEDYYPNWIDDKSIIVGAIKKSLKSLPTDKIRFFEEYFPDDETVKDFGERLFQSTITNNDKLLEIIKPTLENWDHDRLAIIDMILLKMAISELTNFETIPTKVTLNEYMEISKMYSTAKSKDFINGVLDRLLKELESGGKIAKSGRGLEES